MSRSMTRPAVQFQLDTVDPLAAEYPGMTQFMPSIPPMALQDEFNLLMQLRNNNPFLQIIRPPNIVKGILLAATTPVDVPIPDAVQLVRFKGNNDYYVSFKGKATIPLAAGLTPNDITDSMFRPEEGIYFIGNIAMLSLIASNAATAVTISMWSTGVAKD